MALKTDLIGRKTDPVLFRYGWKDAVLYALGVGAKEAELDFLLDTRGPRVLPTFAVVPSFTSLIQITGDVGANPAMVVHGEQKIVLHRRLPPEATVATVSEAKAMYDKGPGKGTVIVVECRTTIADGPDAGAALFDNVSSVFVRGEGGWGGERGPETAKIEPPARPPDFEVVESTTREQALLYRLCGDYNPLHADPGFARAGGFDRPILHGLCTYGFAGRAILRGALGGDETRLKSFAARFAGVVFPGDTLITRGWDRGDGSWVVTTSTAEGRVVLSNAVAVVA
jgi:acyl dehydratase